MNNSENTTYQNLGDAVMSLKGKFKALKRNKVLQSIISPSPLRKIDIDMANKHMERCSVSLILREIKITTRMRYHYIPLQWLNIKTLFKASTEDVE